MSTNKATPYQVCGVSFGFYTSDEIRELSVMEVENEQSFDVLGHAISGGLCDSAFGPAKKNEFCKTCGLIDCSGHFGHINLPFPVFNPVLIRPLFQMLSMCCLSCDRLLLSPVGLEIAIAQTESLRLGFDYIMEELDRLGWFYAKASDSLDQETIRDYVRLKLKERLDHETELTKTNNSEICNARNIVEKRQKLFKELIGGKYIKPMRTCIHCNGKKQGLSIVNNSMIMLTTTGQRKIASQKKTRLSKNAQNTTIENEENEENEANESVTETTAKLPYLTPAFARTHLRQLWNNDKETLRRLFAFLNDETALISNENSPIEVFFLDAIAVPPNCFRPLHYLNGRQFENERTAALNQIMIASRVLSESLKKAKYGSAPPNEASTSNASASQATTSDKAKNVTRFYYNWQKLQILVNRLYDCDLDKMPDKKYDGVKQLLEKKEGLFRKHMMGKRVNFAARSVISPDPYIRSDEIGIPYVFATKLSYPQPVTKWNVDQLTEMVLNGPNKHPGAISVQFEDGTNIRLKPDDIDQRKSIANRLSTGSFRTSALTGTKIVYRHLITGDVLLLNRQPTLHKPSIMAHVARVLPNEKTLRLHYSNCKCYNADFDGDEMNAHFPQNELARAEAYQIANVNHQYLVPKDGSPLSGLIQDHIVAGALLTIRGRFFTKGDYQELLYSSLSFLNAYIKTLPPAIIKPKKLWSGKQIISSIILNIVPKGKIPPTFSISSKVSPKLFQSNKPKKYTAGGTPLQENEMSESEVIFRQGELMTGIIDKANLGSQQYGLIHLCYELYGGDSSAALFTSFARLCTHYLQLHHGFTLGIEDILVNDKANNKRHKYIARSNKLGEQAACEAMGITDDEDKLLLQDKLQSAHTNKSDIYMKLLDKSMKQQTDEINNNITEACLPKGLVKKFPDNNMQLMIQAGAKGGSVNAIQISCLLGQIELEGRRPPLMMSGKSLPSFKMYDTSPRAGGFVSGRFMTGIRPQEFFFHCMAGREGLIDTAVKTSRSGYLQRCLIKHLEGLLVNYDMTVRDSDGSIIQLMYGEDGIDIVKSQMLNKKALPLVVQNNEIIKPNDNEIQKLMKSTDFKNMKNYDKKIQKWIKKNQLNRIETPKLSPFLKFVTNQIEENPNSKRNSKERLINRWHNLNESDKKKYQKYTNHCPDPLNSKFQSDVHFGAISEKMDDIIADYIKNNPFSLLASSDEESSKVSPLEFRRTINSHYMKSLCHPGEAVGLLAAQSIGEPSTQMTLNTFHFAGRGEMNVTLGIPRLREILMTASAKIATPSMDIPFLSDYDGNIEKDAEKIRRKMSSVKLCDVLECIDVNESLHIHDGNRNRIYDIKFTFLPYKYYKAKFNTNPKRNLHFMESKFFKQLIDAFYKKMAILTKSHGLFDHSSKGKREAKKSNQEDYNEDNSDVMNDIDNPNSGNNLEEEMSSEDEAADGEGDTTANRHVTRRNQEQEYEEPEEEEIQLVENSDDEDVNGETITNVNEETITNANEETSSNVNEEETNEENEDNERKMAVKMAKRQAKQAELEAQKQQRQNKVALMSPSIEYYDFDVTKEEWCQVKLKFDLLDTQLDIGTLIEEEAKKTYLYKFGTIERAFLVKDPEAARKGLKFDKIIKTEGVSLKDVVEFDKILDVKRVYSNDIHAIANTYGIEAAAKAIRREISNVFAAYGIQVDPRHLSLISDYMTFSGTIKGMNRMAMEGVSPIQAMTFETTTAFLKNATLIGLKDDLSSPSARIVVGRAARAGTGLIDVLSDPIPYTSAIAQSQSFGQSFGSVLKKDKWKKTNFERKRKFVPNDTSTPLHSLNKRTRLS